jgi:hemerythrin-like domain-containing protein
MFYDATPGIGSPKYCIDNFISAKNTFFLHHTKEDELIFQTLRNSMNRKVSGSNIMRSFNNNINEVLTTVKEFPIDTILKNSIDSHRLYRDYKKMLEYISERFLLEEDVIYNMYNVVNTKR